MHAHYTTYMQYVYQVLFSLYKHYNGPGTTSGIQEPLAFSKFHVYFHLFLLLLYLYREIQDLKTHTHAHTTFVSPCVCIVYACVQAVAYALYCLVEKTCTLV